MKRILSFFLMLCLLTGCRIGGGTASRPAPTTAPGPAASNVPSVPAGSGSGGASSLPFSGPEAPAQARPDGPWALQLVSARSPLPEDFTVLTRPIRGYDQRMFDSRAADALEGLLNSAEAEGCPLYLVSAYRSTARQKSLFTRKTNYYRAQGLTPSEAEVQAARLVARPGTSEHNLGLAADLVSADWYNIHDDLTTDFDTTPHFAWLQANAARFGFILRYPKGKEKLTGVEYEPWHYRYVGPAAASVITSRGLCLEEYLHSYAAPEKEH